LDDGPSDADERLQGKDDRTFGDGVDVAAERHGPEVLEEGRLEERLAVVPRQRREVGKVVLVEAKALEELEGAMQAAGHGEAAPERTATKEELKDRLLLVRFRFPVRIRHRQLIEIRQERQRAPVEIAESRHGVLPPLSV
jgi:hypothetical protein